MRLGRAYPIQPKLTKPINGFSHAYKPCFIQVANPISSTKPAFVRGHIVSTSSKVCFLNAGAANSKQCFIFGALEIPSTSGSQGAYIIAQQRIGMWSLDDGMINEGATVVDDISENNHDGITENHPVWVDGISG